MTPIRRRTIALSAFAAVVLAAAAGRSETITTKSFAYFMVGGRTAEDLDRELSRRGPSVATTGRRHPGATEMEFGGNVKYTRTDRRCRIDGATVTLKTRIILPRWKNRRSADADLALIWDTLSRDIKRHEERHAEIARQHARKLEEAILKLRPRRSCEDMQKAVQETTDTILAAHDREQKRFDRTESINFDDRMIRLLQYRTDRLRRAR